jgi:LysM repeat protein
MFSALRSLAERFWIWLGGEVSAAESHAVRPGSGQFVSAATKTPAERMDAGPPDEYVGPCVYIVPKGETLHTVAQRFHVSPAAIIERNRLVNAEAVRPGYRLLIPAPEFQVKPEAPPRPASDSAVGVPPLPAASSLPLREPAPESEPVSVAEAPAATPPAPRTDQYTYTVQPGDSLMGIARHFNVTVRSIIEANDVPDPNRIEAGCQLVIPGVAWLSPGSAPGEEPAAGAAPPAARLPHAWFDPIPWPADAVRAVYLSHSVIGHEAHRRRLAQMLTTSEVNALVIDAKGEHGVITYSSDVAMDWEMDADSPAAEDFEELMDFFKANSIYTVARIVAFKDNRFAAAYPDWAVHREDGELWYDRKGRAWIDPLAQAAWEYLVDLAEEAAHMGFDEIQFDEVRFPAQSQVGVPVFGRPTDGEARVAAVASFLRFARERLASLKVRVGVALSGYACWRSDEGASGQDIQRIAPYVDVIAPVLYPSSFHTGVIEEGADAAHPYRIVHAGTQCAVRRVEPFGCSVRPWIQDFPDPAADKRAYRPADVRAQMWGSFNAGGAGYSAWNAGMAYSMKAYLKNTIDMRPSDDYN